MKNELQNADAEFRIEDIEIPDLVLLFPSYDGLIDPNHRAFGECIRSHYVFGLSLYLTIIGKNLTTANYKHWMKRRRASLASPLGLPHDDPKLLLFEPTIQVCQHFNREVRGL